MEEVRREAERLDRESSIAARIVELAGDPSITNALKLAHLILKSYILPKLLKKPSEPSASEAGCGVQGKV